jgi:hypothetical protein
MDKKYIDKQLLHFGLAAASKILTNKRSLTPKILCMLWLLPLFPLSLICNYCKFIPG